MKQTIFLLLKHYEKQSFSFRVKAIEGKLQLGKNIQFPVVCLTA
jgi:hypothetical protein